MKYTVISQSNKETVVAEYHPITIRSSNYQSESELEKQFISMLVEQSYEYIQIHNEKDLISNLKKQLSILNNYEFSDNEWQQFLKNYLIKDDDGIEEKTYNFQENFVFSLKRDNGETKNIKIVDKIDIYNNKLQIINQYESKENNVKNRYDVTILVNGIPLVHIELKRRGLAIKEAFNQINYYNKNSFSGLFEYIQIFVISNGTNTKYYSNTTRFSYIKSQNQVIKTEKTSNSFEFTSFWADAKNNTIADLTDFTRTFFAKHTLLNILTKYCVFTVDKKLIVMRPYQIVATERIINKIKIATNYKKYGTIEAGGYIWHTTGSGKTLTSFKTVQLASKLDYIDKILFVVDRKDLDLQTIQEYDRFQKGSANYNTSTKILQKQLEDPTSKIIITTIQKLSIFINKNKNHPIFNKKVVLIFDECHRSQFGNMHNAIIKNFKKYYIFGFTGTPIFSVDANYKMINAHQHYKMINYIKTTEQVFGAQLHVYTIVNAINDRNVLPFKIEYLKTMKQKEEVVDEKIKDINRKAAYNDPKRISLITKYIIEHFNQKTYRNEKRYESNSNRINGFNSILATSSIESAQLYYTEFKKQIKKLDDNNKLKVAIIYSYGASEYETSEIIDEENVEDTFKLTKSSRDFLESAIQDYNSMFHSNFSINGEDFQNYYGNISERMKNREIDILIVVNMFLTGFNSTFLNTLWVDKNLEMHGLIQAFSRTNRILNDIKVCGNIVVFRPLQRKINEAISIFGDKDVKGIILIKSYDDYYNGYYENGTYIAGYKELINELLIKFPLDNLISGEKKEKDFLVLFGKILKMRNLLSSFDNFTENKILKEIDFQDYCSRYLDLKPKLNHRELKNINEDIVFEIELIKQEEVNIDYILMLVKKLRDSHNKDINLGIMIDSAIKSSPNLRSKCALIKSFLNGIDNISDVLSAWHNFVSTNKENEIKQIIESENLKKNETYEFIENAFKEGFIKTSGTDLDQIMPPISRFSKNNRIEKKERIIQKINNFFEKFYGI